MTASRCGMTKPRRSWQSEERGLPAAPNNALATADSAAWVLSRQASDDHECKRPETHNHAETKRMELISEIIRTSADTDPHARAVTTYHSSVQCFRESNGLLRWPYDTSPAERPGSSTVTLRF